MSSQDLRFPPDRTPTSIVINNSNTMLVGLRGARRSNFASLYRWLLLLGIPTLGIAWMLIPLVALAHLCVHLRKPGTRRSRSAPAAALPRPLDELIGHADRTHAQRLLTLGFQGGYLSTEEYFQRFAAVGVATTVGGIAALTADLPPALREQAVLEGSGRVKDGRYFPPAT